MSRVIAIRQGQPRAVIMAGLRGASGIGGGGSAGVTSFNTRTGTVTLTGADVTDALAYTPADNASLATVAFSGEYSDLSGTPSIPASPGDIGAATAAQGALADTAVQPGDLATVATSGQYSDLAGRPNIPSSAAEVGAIPVAEKGAANGVATLDAGAKIPLAQLPATAITDTSVVASEAAMLALTAQTGDVAIRTDISTSFILRAEPASTLSNWQEILAPAAGGGAAVGSDTPQALGAASPGVSTSASRQDHVHPMPTAADVGAAAASHGHGTATGSEAGFMSAADKTKLDGVATNANNYVHPNHTGDVTSAGDGATVIANGVVTNAKLANVNTATLKGRSTAGSGAPEDLSASQVRSLLNVADGATANSSDATLLNRANHTGTQAISTVSGLQTALDAKAAIAGLPSRTITASGAVTPADAGHWLICDSATPITLTIGAEATASWAIAGILPMFHVLQVGAGAVTITGDGFSVTTHSDDTNVLDGNGAAATALRTAGNTWRLFGRLVAA